MLCNFRFINKIIAENYFRLCSTCKYFLLSLFLNKKVIILILLLLYTIPFKYSRED